MTPSGTRLDEIVNEIREAQVSSLRLVGERLSEAQEIFRYDRNEGGFTGWVESRLSLSVSTAYRIMDVYKNIDTTMFRDLANLSNAAILALAEPSTPDALRQEAAATVAAGGTMTADEIRRRRTETKREQRELREVELAGKQLELPEKRYGVILADPPWKHEVYSEQTGMDRAADNHYPTMTFEQICEMPVGERMAADDCVLFVWATIPQLRNAQRIVTAWGFDYKSCAVWVKDKQGTGYWFRQQHEILLVATRGNVPCPAPGTQWSSVIDARRGKHSEKPIAAYELIEAYFPNLPKIELFARAARAGWDRWGFDAPADDSAEAAHAAYSAAAETGAADDQPILDDSGTARARENGGAERDPDESRADLRNGSGTAGEAQATAEEGGEAREQSPMADAEGGSTGPAGDAEGARTGE